MALEGTVVNGVVVLDAGTRLPEGCGAGVELAGEEDDDDLFPPPEPVRPETRSWRSCGGRWRT